MTFRCRNIFGVFAFALAMAGTFAPAAQANSWLEKTRIVSTTTPGGHSAAVVAARGNPYGLSGADTVTPSSWNSDNSSDVSMLYLTPMRSNVGLLWGFSAGESGEQYRIGPSLTAGLLNRVELSRQSQLSLSVTTILGGYLSGQGCSGGGTSGTCVRSGGAAPGSGSLQDSLRLPPPDQVRLSVRYRLQF